MANVKPSLSGGPVGATGSDASVPDMCEEQSTKKRERFAKTGKQERELGFREWENTFL